MIEVEKIVFEPVRTKKQIGELCQLAEEIWRQHFTSIIGEGQVEYMLDRFQSETAIAGQLEDGYEYYRFLYKHEYIGYIGIHREEKKLFLSKLYLKKDYRGRGFARQAYTFIQEIARKEGLRSIYLTVNKENFTTIAVYERMGFVTVDKQKADIGGGYYMDDYIMEAAVPVNEVHTFYANSLAGMA